MSKSQCHVTKSRATLLVLTFAVFFQGSSPHSGEGMMESALCHAQCLALCREMMKNVSLCDCEVTSSLQETPKNRLRLSDVDCAGQQKYDCPGTCFNFQNQSESGSAPARPEVRIYNDAPNNLLILKWTPPTPSDLLVIYVVAVVQAGQVWIPVAEVSDETEVKLHHRRGPCYSPDIRVTAVSSAGTSGFSAAVGTVVSQPGPPRNVEISRLDYSPSSYDNETVHYTLQWKPDTGWSVHDVQYQVTVEAECPDVLLDQVYVINDDIHYDDESFMLNGRIPTYAFGCTFIFKVTLTQACDQEVQRDTAEYTFTLDCQDVENYSGDNCRETPVVDPGPVKEVKVTKVQLPDGAVLLLVSWLPPDNLGSAGYVSSYLVVWGLVNTSPPGSSLTDFLFQMDFVKVLGNLTLTGTELGTDVYGNTSDLLPGTDMGVLIRAVGPGQILLDLMGSIYMDTTQPLTTVDDSDDQGMVLADDGTVLAVQYARLRPPSEKSSWETETYVTNSHVTSSHVLEAADGDDYDDDDDGGGGGGGAVGAEDSNGDALVSGNSTDSSNLVTSLPGSEYNDTTAAAGNETLASVSISALVTSPNDSVTTAPPEGRRGSLVDVLLYWRRHRLGVRAPVVGFTIRWWAAAGGNISSDSSDDGTEFWATSRVDYLPVYNLSSNLTYDIKIKPIENWSVAEAADTDWSNVTVYTFTTRALPEVTTEPISASITDPTPVFSSERVTYALTTAYENEVTTDLLRPTSALKRLSPDDHNDLTITTIAVSTSAAAVLLCCLVGAFWCKRKRMRRPLLSFMSAPDDRNYSIYVPGKSLSSVRNAPPVSDEWELPMSCVKFGPVLGSGAFGKVVKGRISRAMLAHRGVASILADYGACLQDGDTLQATVAIKMLQGDCEGVYKQDFLKEIQLMKKIGYHENIVCMLGCCTLRDPVCLVVEHVGQGDLLNYLKGVRHRLQSLPEDKRHYVNSIVEVIDPLDLLRFAGHITRGMEFLASKGFVHRDLAARNVLVGNNRVCKIGDFGLARYIYDNAVYVNRRGGRLPVKWMSVEAIFDMTFSTASDVWSFGIVLFEIATLGGAPYPTVPTRDLLKELQRGYRMEKPDTCSQDVYSIMRRCWNQEPSVRPSFALLSQWLESMVVEGSAKGHIDLTGHLGHALYGVGDDDEDGHQDPNPPPALTQEFTPATNSAEPGRQDMNPSDREHAETSNTYTVTLSEDSGYVGQQKMSVSSSESNLTAARLDSDSGSGSPTSLSASNATGSSPSLSASYAESGLDDVFYDDAAEMKDSRNSSRRPTSSVSVKESPRTRIRSGFVRRHSSSSSAKPASFIGSASSLIKRNRRHSETDIDPDASEKFSSHGSAKRPPALNGNFKSTLDISVRTKRGNSRSFSVDNQLYRFWSSLNTKTPPSCRPIRKRITDSSRFLQSVVEGELIKQSETSPYTLEIAPLSSSNFAAESFINDSYQTAVNKDDGQQTTAASGPGSPSLTSNLMHRDGREVQAMTESGTFELRATTDASDTPGASDTPDTHDTPGASDTPDTPGAGRSDCNEGETGSPWIGCPLSRGEGEMIATAGIERFPSMEESRPLSGHCPVDRRSSDSKLTLSPYGSSCSSAPPVGSGECLQWRQGKAPNTQGASRFWWPTPRKRRMGTADDLHLDVETSPRVYPNEKHPSALFVVGHAARRPARRTVSSLDY